MEKIQESIGQRVSIEYARVMSQEGHLVNNPRFPAYKDEPQFHHVAKYTILWRPTTVAEEFQFAIVWRA